MGVKPCYLQRAFSFGQSSTLVTGWEAYCFRQGSNALDSFMKRNGSPNRAEYGRNGFWTIRLSHLIERKLNLTL